MSATPHLKKRFNPPQAGWWNKKKAGVFFPASMLLVCPLCLFTLPPP